MSRFPFIFACALSLAACGEQKAYMADPAMHIYQAGGIFLAADFLSLTNSGKTIDDHVIGMATNQDCSTLRASKGGPWCVPNPPPVAMVAVTEYCYKSLASASCYTAPLPVDQANFNGARTDLVPAP